MYLHQWIKACIKKIRLGCHVKSEFRKIWKVPRYACLGKRLALFDFHFYSIYVKLYKQFIKLCTSQAEKRMI